MAFVPGYALTFRRKAMIVRVLIDIESMPREFSTPMFWSEDERSALKGTDIEGTSTTLVARKEALII